MTIRAKLYAAIVLTILGPLATTAVALHGMGQMGDRFDQVREHAASEAVALQLKFHVTDVNGWHTAYGYDGGASRPIFERSVAAFRRDLRRAARTLGDTRGRELLRELRGEFAAFMARDDARRRLIAVAAGAAVVIVLLLVTANDIARMALEGERSTRRRPGTPASD